MVPLAPSRVPPHAAGLPRHMIQNWMTAGVLLRTGKRGVYGATAQTEHRIAAYQARANAV